MLSRLAVSLIVGALPFAHLASPADFAISARGSIGVLRAEALQARYQISVANETREARWSRTEKSARFYPITARVTDENGRPVPDVLVTASCVSIRPGERSTPGDRCEADAGLRDGWRTTNADGVILIAVVVRTDTPSGARAVALRLSPGGSNRNLFGPVDVRSLFVVP